MNQQSKKLIALLAFVLFSVRGRAEVSTSEKIDGEIAVIEKVQAKLRSQPELADLVPKMTKPQLEEFLQQSLSDDDYYDLHILLVRLAFANAHVEVVKPIDIILGTQEVYGGAK